MEIDARTRLVALIGNPVSHSLSPVMQNRAFAVTGVNCRYLAFAVEPDEVGDAIKGLKALNAMGANVTIPHKLEAAKHVDEVVGEAFLVGAVNTIVIDDERRAIGYNTDAPGLVNALREAGYAPGNSSAVMFGAGGAARAAAYALASMDISRLCVVNRNVSRGLELAGELTARHPDLLVQVYGFEDESVIEELRRASLVLNATSLGLDGRSSPLDDLSPLSRDCLVCDMVYGVHDTPLVTVARSRGLRVVDGLSVLLHQGALSFKLWVGVDAPIEEMRKALEMEISKRR